MLNFNQNTLKVQLYSDKLASSLSILCVIHCLFVPSFIILSSGFLSFSIDNEAIHNSLLIIGVPVSLYALISGYRHHLKSLLLIIGVVGLLILVSAVTINSYYPSEFFEKFLTLVGSSLVVYSHFKNHQVCKTIDCSCHYD